jgi:hypothetical protein
MNIILTVMRSNTINIFCVFLNTEVYVQYKGKLTVLTHIAQHVLCVHGSDYASQKMVNKRGRAHAGNSALLPGGRF